MPTIEISLQQARSLQILSLGLGQPRTQPAQKQDILPVIRRMGVLQLDTIHIVARSHYFVLWSRLGAYRPEWLDELLSEKKLYEYWAHAACLLPIEDYPLLKWRMDKAATESNDPSSWFSRNSNLIDTVRCQVTERGPVRSADFIPESREPGTWWSWKAEKSALEALYDQGVLMIARRDKFQRVYELASRLHPELTKQPVPDAETARASLIERTVKILGVSQPRWVADYYRLPRRETLTVLDQLLKKGNLLPVNIEGWDVPGIIHPENLPLLQEIQHGSSQPVGTSLLSPFDPLVWDRTRLQCLFGMDFRVECYTLPEKRKYGYWLLPVLHKDQFAARVDIKANRQRKVLELRGIFLEPGMKLSDELVDGLSETIKNCSAWHQLETVEIGTCENTELREGLQARLK